VNPASRSGENTMAVFTYPEWASALMEKLNSDEKYAQIARNWEGDVLLQVDPDGILKEPISYYLDLWHGKCRQAYIVDSSLEKTPVFTIKAPYNNFVRILKGELDPMQALLTRKLNVQGNMAVLMRNVPVVLDFVRCAREITDSFC
jgi:putative sterol carrier protein